MLNEILNIKTIDEALEECKKIKKSKDRQKRREKLILERETRDIDLTWNILGHGFLYEGVEALRTSGNNIKGTPATDNIVFDLFTAKVNIGDLTSYKEDIVSSIEKIGKIPELRKDRFTNLTDEYKNYNFRIRAVIDSLNQLLAENNIQDDFFIYHESLKLYRRAEERKTDEFTGRTLNIYNALDSLYAANGIAGL